MTSQGHIKRVQRELVAIQGATIPGFGKLKVNDKNVTAWEAVILPDKAPYDKGAFRFSITFPVEYPFKPPLVVFKTKIYHPNVDDKGNTCLALINKDNWKPATTILMVIQGLVEMINNPDPKHPLVIDIAKEFTEDNSKFMKQAEWFTKKYSERR